MVAPRTTKRVKTVAPERWEQIENLFHRAAECTVEQRAALLDEACRNDADLRLEVEELLSSDCTPGDDFQSAVRSELGMFDFPRVGENVSHYRILEGLGGGGMGLVYRAEDIKLGRQVAIKFLPEESATDPTSLGRFEREARSASALEHPNICPIYEFGEHDGRPFLVMQLLEGQTLRELISTSDKGEAPFELNPLFDLAIQILDGLDAAHRKGIVHRDIKPANVFVTKQRQAKILDFGLAKLTQNQADDDAGAAPGVTSAPADLLLSQTGVAMGTAGYMSPEQLRGEKLDARTDLFSFGLVLYEMATGRRAFAGETGSLLEHAILNQTPSPVREVNPAVPPKLERIINKALDKNLQSRYQTAAEIRADLETLRRELGSRRSRRWAAAVGTLALFTLVGSFWFAKRQQQPPSPPISFRQLTANSSENRITGASISPDGQFLLYTDRTGMHYKVIATGATHTIRLPEQLRKENMELSIADSPWSRDSRKFLANAHPSGIDVAAISEEEAIKRGGVSIWEFSVPGGAFRKLRDMASADSYSPDGSLISFRANKGRLGTREIWLMDSNGNNAREIFESGDDSAIGTFLWSPDGRRVSYLRDNGSTLLVHGHFWEGNHIGSEIPHTDLPPRFADGSEVLDGLELPDGRAVFAVQEHGTVAGNSCNFWTVKIDPRTGSAVDKPHQLTHWPGFCMSHISVTEDGKKLAFVQWAFRATIYAADLQAGGTQIANERHFSLSDSGDFPIDWTPDSKSVIFVSNRSGRDAFYSQRLDGDSPEVLLNAPAYSCCISPDGRWFIYLIYDQSSKNPLWQLMRVPITGGPSQEIVSARSVIGCSCARSPSSLCVIVEQTENRKQAVVTAFDPSKGRASELTRISLDPETKTGQFELSPDGSRLAVIRNTGSPLQILSIKGVVLHEIKIPTWDDSGPIRWAPDNKSLYVPVAAPEGASLLHVRLGGGVHVLRANGGPYTSALPSPDGRHIAIGSSVKTENVWMMENF
jgi:eukaryotic-like serine/threonine-protein kinase